MLDREIDVNELSFLPFAAPEIGDDEINEVVDSLRSGWITTGAKAKRFEADFAEWLGGGVEAIAVNSATAGLHLALEAAGIGPQDEVIVPTHTFTATAEVVRYLGATPVFVDIDPVTLCIDPDMVERAITRRTKAVMPVHFGGLSADMTRLAAIARDAGILIVEDAAHALPTTHAGKLIGTLESKATVFSFYANKTITTGEGGMLVTRDPELARRARVMRTHGISRDAFDRFTSKHASWSYEVVAPGFKYNLTDIAAAIGIHQLRKAHLFQEQRRSIAARYDEAFADLPLKTAPRAPDGDIHSWHLYVIRLNDGAPSRDTFIERMFHSGIGVSVHYIPLHRQPYWRDTLALDPADYPVSEDVFSRAVSVPIYAGMSEVDIDRVIGAVRNAVTS